MRIALFLTLLGGLSLPAQQIKSVPIARTRADSGKQMFEAYCASCHGLDGKGNGPAASALKAQPADLTMLAANNGGKFPNNNVAVTISSVSSPVHGSKEMPIWGPLLSAVSTSQGEVQLRVSNLVHYIESLQQKN